MDRWSRALAGALVLGIAVGVAAQALDGVHALGAPATALGVPWLAAAFAAGALAGDRRRGTGAGALALCAGTLVYYVLHVTVYERGGEIATLPIVGGWAVAACAGGAIFGLAGAAWRTATPGQPLPRAAGVALLSGALAGEALLLTGDWTGRGARVVLAAELAAGLALPFLLARRRALAPALLLTLVVALGAGFAEASVRDTLRGAGWNGA